MLPPDEYSLYSKQSRGQKVVSMIEEMYQKVESYVDFNNKLSSLRVRQEDLEAIAHECIDVLDKNEETITKEEILKLLNECY